MNRTVLIGRVAAAPTGRTGRFAVPRRRIVAKRSRATAIAGVLEM
jgi:hypothetical protein